MRVGAKTMLSSSPGLALPSLLLFGLLAVLALQTGIVRPGSLSSEPAIAPETVVVPPHAYTYRAVGDFQRGTAAIDGPLIAVPAGMSLEIMTYQVSATDYARCVTDRACKPAEPRRHGTGNVPATGVSFDDATAYAAWLSDRTGDGWRLPTVAEWEFAAGGKAVDIGLGRETDATNPADRWLAYYEKEAALGANALATPSPLGSFGTNEFGLADLSATVWEWTTSCGGRTTFDTAGAVVSHLDSCGVRILEGAHRSQMTHFIRDAAGGGCSSGTPPDNLGFRLVRERNWIDGLHWTFSAVQRGLGL